MSVRLEDETVPKPLTVDLSEVKTAIGVDLGIRKLASVSNNELIPNPQFAKQVKRRRAILSRAASRKNKGSKNRAKAYQRLGSLDHKIGNQRSDYQWKVANKLVKSADAIIFEAVNVKGMMARCKPKEDPLTGKYLKNGQAAKSGLNRAISDAAWSDLKLKTKAVAEKLGVIVHEIDPRHTSQECSHCHHISPVNRKDERFVCENCGYLEDADLQASKNILERGLKSLGIDLPQLPEVLRKVTLMESGKPETSSGLLDEPRNPQQEWVQLSLFEWRGI